ncbi:MAG: hypothetical protein CM15mP21_6520 [Hyphomicrobiales bacterium]|nr:MAG: hypothetical protein CM15mP21_6520 [Hyphomicrobiales bacterium]
MSGVQHRAVKPDDDGMRLDRWFRKYFAGLTHSRREIVASGAYSSGRYTCQSQRPGADRPAGACAAGSSARRAIADTRFGPCGSRWSRVCALLSSIVTSICCAEQAIRPGGSGGSKTSQHVDGILPELTFGAPEVPRLVHRLDRDTSGLLVLAEPQSGAVSDPPICRPDG